MGKDVSAKEGKVVTQPEINIGIIGHVDHGKTTLLQRLSGKWADTHSEEMKRGITIRLGYADVTFYKNKDGVYGTDTSFEQKTEGVEKLRKVSFVDAPGHESLMATMLAGATIIDGALLLIAATESCPQPQTREHIMALSIIGVKNIVVVQNKIDLVSEEDTVKHHKQIVAFLDDTPFKGSPVIPLSAQHGAGISQLIECIEDTLPTPQRQGSEDAQFLVARSFDVNKPGTRISKLVGGVLGGVLRQGTLKAGQEIEIRPGYEVVEKNQKHWKPLVTLITAIQGGGGELGALTPGGSVGLLTSLDPSLVSSDKLSGAIVGEPGTLPPVWENLTLEVHLLERVVGSKVDLQVEMVKQAEALMLNVNAAATVGIVVELKKDKLVCRLKLPVCAAVGSRVTISRMIDNRFRLIGYGIIQK